ncbi:hypothetical protein ACGP04_03710 [Piscirickettsia salmonis]|uniref:hypothetical protein n=1 Tax=Piscirickettsia salmonis TaxID=1238 RepID=UPI0011CEA849
MISFKELNNNEFYKELVNSKEVTNILDCPILSKRDYDRTINSLNKCYEYTEPFWSSVYWSPTGGSTSSNSKSMYFPWDNDESEKQRSLMGEALSNTSTGVFSRNNVVANLFTGTSMYRSLELFNKLVTNAGVTSLPIGSNCSNEDTHEFLEHFNADIIAGPPVTIADYASYYLKNGGNKSISGILYATNPLFPAQEHMINKAFNNPDIFSVYGSAETGPWAFHNSKILDKNKFIIVSSIADVEIIDQDDDGFGDIVITIKVRKRFPVVRYSIGDIGKLSEFNLDGKNYQLLEVKGRNSQWLSYADMQIELDKVSSELNYYLDWQIVQYFEKNSNIEVVNIRVLSDGNNIELLKLENKFNTLLHVSEFKGALKVNVEFVSLEGLIKSKISNKVIKIFDIRNG